ncbi:Serine/threonine exchanger SteT [Mesomycoplasma dispar]|uniref:Serine/threonine exchanger SteT n=1 Tax=Mesomycoplasma dispar TaxID=86660 RepID=A0AAJ5TCW4_9BACT|nr:amino acid permease [Mesomycoplasma dispar]AJR12205.1 membrane protein [Mesomycoplasma dispar]VEU61796.1 Serine/threonine exchanger SteT [Mesomycoplasma dispar]
MSLKSSRKLGFFAALSMLVGSVVGIGIFFKNNSVANATGHNGYAWLFAWIIGGIISLFSAISFSEISFLKQTKLNGLANWAYQTAGKKAGYGVLFNYGFYYLGMLTLILGIYVSEITIWFIETVSGSAISLPFYVHLIIGTVFVAFFTALNYLSVKVSGYIALVTTILKFIPLIFAVFTGILFPKTYNAGGSNAFIQTSENAFDFSKLVLALPAVLFAYDSFLSVGSIHNKVEKANKRVPLIITVGMIIIVIVYTLIGLSSALHNKGTITSLIQDVFPKSAANSISIFVAFFLLISTYGVTNSINASFVNQITDLVKLNAIVGAFSLRKKFSAEKVTILYLFITLLFWALIIYIPSVAIPLPKEKGDGSGFGSDVIADAMSNFPSLIFFGVYTTIIVAYSRKKHQLVDPSKQINKYLFWISAVISSLLTLIAIVAFIYSQIYAVATKINQNSGAGTFQTNGLILTNFGNFFIFLFNLFIFTTFPFINHFLIKAVDKIDVLKNFDEKEIEIPQNETDLDSSENPKETFWQNV